jgi:hypothetical protein
MIEPATHNVNAWQGATYKLNMTYSLDGSPVDLTGYTAKMRVGNTGPDSPLVLNLNSGTEIVLGGAAGTIAVTVTDAVMAGVDAGHYLYEFEMDTGTEIVKLLLGTFSVVAEINV